MKHRDSRSFSLDNYSSRSWNQEFCCPKERERERDGICLVARRFERFRKKYATGGKFWNRGVKGSKGSAVPLITDWPGIRIYCADHFGSPDAAAIISRRNYLPSAVNRSEATLCWPVPGSRRRTTAPSRLRELQRQRGRSDARPKSWDEIWLDEGLTSSRRSVNNKLPPRSACRFTIPVAPMFDFVSLGEDCFNFHSVESESRSLCLPVSISFWQAVEGLKESGTKFNNNSVKWIIINDNSVRWMIINNLVR